MELWSRTEDPRTGGLCGVGPSSVVSAACTDGVTARSRGGGTRAPRALRPAGGSRQGAVVGSWLVSSEFLRPVEADVQPESLHPVHKLQREWIRPLGHHWV